jgi:hypothetical protein
MRVGSSMTAQAVASVYGHFQVIAVCFVPTGRSDARRCKLARRAREGAARCHLREVRSPAPAGGFGNSRAIVMQRPRLRRLLASQLAQSGAFLLSGSRGVDRL